MNQKFTDKQLISFIKKCFDRDQQYPPYWYVADHFNVAVNAIAQRMVRLERDGLLMRNKFNNLVIVLQKTTK